MANLEEAYFITHVLKIPLPRYTPQRDDYRMCDDREAQAAQQEGLVLGYEFRIREITNDSNPKLEKAVRDHQSR